MVNKILFITLSNIGDCILTLPVLDALRANFPVAKITVMAGLRPKELFENNPYIERLVVFNKRSKLSEKLKLFQRLKKEHFDLVIDLRNSLFGALLMPKYAIASILPIPKEIKHMQARHLYKIQNSKFKTQNFNTKEKTLYIRPQDEEYIKTILKENNIRVEDRIIVISTGARSHIKRWSKDKFLGLIPLLIRESQAKVILVGDKEDAAINQYIAGHLNNLALDLSQKTSLLQLAALLNKARLLITNDSATMHLASYLNLPVIAIFGPTDEAKYGPWSAIQAVVKKEIPCRPCQKAQCKFGTLECMSRIRIEDVLRPAINILTREAGLQVMKPKYKFRRILVVRTDRLGDVLLSTPVIKALRDYYPQGYIAMMVSPYASQIVESNPYLDEVIIYDKDAKHKSWLSSIKFSRSLKKKKFDLALILHPTNRVHLITFFAAIPRRVGYDKKLGFLLTDRIKHKKELGEKHELEYNLDLLKYLGIEAGDKHPFMPIREKSEKWVEDLFESQGLKKSDRLLAIHPGASCPSKIWPQARFAEVADKLIEKYGFKVLVLSGPRDIALAQNMVRLMHYPAVNLGGKTSVSELASLLKRCQLFISNDSGPVHIASSVGLPVIAIFGRKQKGLSPKRWGPLGGRNRILHKDVGCLECLAHNCRKGFLCLQAITTEDVLRAADLIMAGMLP